MYYNTRAAELLPNVPLNGYFEDGTLVQGLGLADVETQKLCGIVPVVSDTPAQPENTNEDVAQRLVTVNASGASVVRVWVENAPPQIVVPATISPRQIRLWLVTHGVSLSSVDAAIDSIENELLREQTKIEWEFSPYVERNHPMINTLGAALGLTGEQIDTAFIEASNL